jgi:hypothetical protein
LLQAFADLHVKLMETAQKVKAADEEINCLKSSMQQAQLVESEIAVRCGYKGKNLPPLMEDGFHII